VRKNFVDVEKTSQSQKGVRNMGTLRYLWEGVGVLESGGGGVGAGERGMESILYGYS
jgi:hypothetical protein